MNNNTYFYACSYPLVQGSIIDPGNWGRILCVYNTQGIGAPWLLLREEIFERIRILEYPNMPSRFSGSFVCETLADLQRFVAENPRPFDLLYEVALINDAPMHRGCLSTLNFDPLENRGTLETKARRYWDGNNIQRPEILTLSRIQILHIV